MESMTEHNSKKNAIPYFLFVGLNL